MGTARERKGQNDEELMDNAMRPHNEDVFYFVFYIPNNELFLKFIPLLGLHRMKIVLLSKLFSPHFPHISS
jgi:hypothetical protein